MKITIELAEEYGIRFIRYPNEIIDMRNLFILRKLPRLLQQISLNFFCYYSKDLIKKYSVDNFEGWYKQRGHVILILKKSK